MADAHDDDALDGRMSFLDHLDELVVKPANESGGKGILIGPQADRASLDRYRERLRANPRGWVAQPANRGPS